MVYSLFHFQLLAQQSSGASSSSRIQKDKANNKTKTVVSKKTTPPAASRIINRFAQSMHFHRVVFKVGGTNTKFKPQAGVAKLRFSNAKFCIPDLAPSTPKTNKRVLKDQPSFHASWPTPSPEASTWQRKCRSCLEMNDEIGFGTVCNKCGGNNFDFAKLRSKT